MSSVAAPYGLRPVKLLGDRVFNHGFKQIKIASGYATSIFTGDLVKLVVGGTIEKDTGTTTATPVGIFMGCSYIDPNLGYFITRQYWPASTVASSAYAFVCDDPDALFMVQADATLGQNAIGTNAAIVQGAGSATTGNSGVSLDASTIASTGTLPLRIVDFWDTGEIDTTYPHMLVKINEGDHMYRNSTGIAPS